MKAATVILNYNGRKHLEQFLPSVVAHTASEIIVIDNGSNDDSLEYLNSTYPDIRCILLDKNYGFAGGYNMGLKELEHDIFILLNSDVEVTSNWDKPLIDVLESDPQVMACQPKIRNYTYPAYFEHAGASGGFLDWLGYACCRGRIFNEVEKDTGQYDDVVDIHWATGAACAIRSTAFTDYGGFDSTYFAHYEEIDLCWRLRNLGFIIKCVPQSTVYHLGGGTLNYNTPGKTYLNFRNSLYTLLKNNRRGSTGFKVFLRLMLDGVAALMFIREGKWGFFKAVLRAHGSFYKHFRHYIRKRKALAKHLEHVNAPPPIFLSRLLIVEYFILKKRTFNRLHDHSRQST